MRPSRTECAVILSSGRCGSTLLSNLIAEEPDTLSVQESLSPLVFDAADLSTAVVSGAAYWALLSRPTPLQNTIVRAGLTPPELRYPAHGRWAGNLVALPPILACTLAAVSTDDPDHLFDTLAGLVPDFPAQPVGAHHQMLLTQLAQMTGKRRWVERSGASSFLAAPLLHAFPTAKVVYLTRNLEDVALSMSRHPIFQLIELRLTFLAQHGVDPYGGGSPGRQRAFDATSLPAHMRHLLPDQLTAQALRERSRDVNRYRLMCAFMINQAEQALSDSPPRHLLRMRYEDLVTEPIGQLTRLGEFIGFADPAGWAACTADRVVSPTPTAASCEDASRD